MSAVWGEITAEDILAPIKGTRVTGKGQAILSGLSTDSRKIAPGELFWALSGLRYDGHDFIEKAIDRGAAGIVAREDYWKAKGGRDKIQKSESQDPVIITVDDTLKSLGDLAGWWRHQHNVRVAAVTGSVGKTTTKEMAAGILGLGKRTLKNQGNLNNLIGLPMTLLLLDGGHRYAVLEMGMNRPGEIARLTEIADPDVGAITNVGMVHLEGLGDIGGVARAKVELVEKISSGGKVVINGDDELLMRTASGFRKDVVTFGIAEGNDVRASRIKDLGQDGVCFDLQFQGGSWPVRLRSVGLQNVLNALAAAAMGICLNVPPEHMVEGLARFTGIKGRFMVSPLPGEVIVVDDTYNANPSSLKAAIESVESLVHEGGRVIVGLGEMMELGDATVPAHLEAGRMVAELGAHCFLAMGEHAHEMVKGAVESGMPRDRAGVVTTHGEMEGRIRSEIREGDLILLKGSRKMGLEKVVEGLKKSLS
jgi:UDP-N-acetylmuramoyl-tripeptide--D-alanyl-D-alanine ligase